MKSTFHKETISIKIVSCDYIFKMGCTENCFFMNMPVKLKGQRKHLSFLSFKGVYYCTFRRNTTSNLENDELTCLLEALYAQINITFVCICTLHCIEQAV